MAEMISEHAILDTYGIQESTFLHVADLGLLPNSVSHRGRIVYQKSPDLDLTLKACKVYYPEISSSHAKILPFHRAFLSFAIAEGPETAYRILDRRGFFDGYTWQDAKRRWDAFLKNVPKPARNFFIGKTDELDPVSEKILKILGIEDAFHTPDLLRMPEIYENLELMTDLEAFLVAKAPMQFIVDALELLHQVTITRAKVECYAHYYFAADLMTATELLTHIKKFQPSSRHARMLTEALGSADYKEFVTKAKYALRFDNQSEMAMIMSRCRPDISVKVCGNITARRQVNAFNMLLKAMDHLGAHEDGELSDYDDILALRHDVAENQRQLSIDDIPEEDLDQPGTGYGSGEPRQTGVDASA